MAFIPAPQPVTIRNERRVGVITATVTVEESGTDELEITQHPVQRGAAITDHAYVKPASVNLRLMFQDSEDKTLEEIYRDLLDLQALREPFEIITGKRIYESMLFKSIAQTTDKSTDSILAVNCSFQQVILVDVVLTTVPPRAKQAKPGKTGGTAKAGAKQAKPVKRDLSAGVMIKNAFLGRK
jgi:hypothetical protein